MTLVLAPDTEERLRSIAVLRGQAPEEALDALIAWALAEATAEQERTLAALQASEEDFAAGRSMTVEELRQRLRERRQEVSIHQNAPEMAAHP